MNELLISVLTMTVMVFASILAYKKTPKGAQLPIQWGLDGTVNASAGKMLAVCLFPAISFPTLIVMLIFFVASNESKDNSHITLGITAFHCALLLLLHIGYLYFAVREVNKAD